jgi:RNA polymerase sigma factor (sigma-70 family)
VILKFRNLPYDDQRLVADCVRKKTKAQEHLFKKYVPYVYTICRRYETQHCMADDIIQDIFIKIFDKIQLYDKQKGSLKNWIARIAVNHALNKVTRQKIQWTTLDAQQIESIALTEEEEDIYAGISEETLLHHIAELPHGYRLVFNMYVIDEIPHAEIAKKLNINVSTSKSQLYKARKSLKETITNIIELSYGS